LRKDAELTRAQQSLDAERAERNRLAAAFVQLTLVNRPMIPIQAENKPKENDLRAHCVPKLNDKTIESMSKSLKRLVGVTGLEPATSTSRT
jgi:hypothetical protein